MKTKMVLFRHTFHVLGIMCCLLLISTTVIFAISGLNSGNIKNAKQQPAAASSFENSTQNNTLPDIKDKQSSDSNNVSEESTSVDESSLNSTDSNDNSLSDKPGQGINQHEGNSPDNSAGVTPPANEPPEPQTVTISAVGDIMLHQSNLQSAYNPKNKSYDFNSFFEYVKPYLTSSDLTIGNFETVTAGSSIGYKSFPLFNTPDSILTTLSKSGFDILSTANNHCLDWGINGLTRTIQKIRENKMCNIGSSMNGQDKYTVRDVKGIKIAFLNYSQFFNGHDLKLSSSDRTKYLSILDEKQIQNDIKSVKSKGAEAVIAVVHWGNEYQRTPSTFQTDLSKKMLSWGADIILGSHPHVIQKSEIVKVNGKDKFIIYSMGNFISGYRRTDKAARPNKQFTEDGVIVRLRLIKSPDGGVSIKEVNYLPTWVDKYSGKSGTVFKILPIPSPDVEAPYINSRNKAFIKQSYNNTMSIMYKK
ncbi:MAG TPA: CapA family protein [Ruminiclostridium sp.]|nr:CapA family protein [Ruminiclostridium sp.]